jgi:capsular exopolysaccharide synthesis family protein
VATSIAHYKPALPLVAADSVVAPVGVIGIFNTYRRHLKLFALVFASIMAIAAAYTFLQVPRYTATASLVVAPRPNEIGSDRGTALSDPAADSSVDTQVELLRSHSLALAVVDRLDLASPARFEALTHAPTMLDRIPAFRSSSDPQVTTAAARREAAAERLIVGLDVHRVAQTFALTISFTHPDRNLAAAIVNTYADRFVDQSTAVKREGTSTAGTLLRGQLASARTEVEAAENALGRYKVAHNLMSVQGYTAAEQQLTSLDDQVTQARAGQAEAEARLQIARQQLSRGSSGDNLGEALNSPVVQQLRSQRAVLSGQVADLSGSFGPKYPPLAAARRQLDDVDTQIQGEINRTIASLEASRDVAGQRVASLTGSAGAARGAVAGNNIASIQLGTLQLRADTARQAYSQLLARVGEINVQSASTQADARIASLAVPPARPSAPNVPINLLVGALLASAAAFGSVFLRQGTDQGLRTLEDVEGRLQLPYLAGLPTLGSAVRRPHGSDPVTALLDHRESAYAEGFRNLAASVLKAADRGSTQTIALTSALPNEGKTTAAIGLARILAMSGTRTVLVDADLRRPNVANALGLRPKIGLQQVLDGQASLADALLLDEESGLMVLPMLRAGIASSSALHDGKFEALLGELKQVFDIVVLDASPVLPVVDGRLVAKMADAAVLLARWRVTPDSAVEMAAHMLQSLGVSVRGVALTRIDLQALARSGYGDPAQFLGTYSTYYAS